MTSRQATAYQLHRVDPMIDKRLHRDEVIKAKRATLRAYTVLAIVWIGDRPHWRSAVTLKNALDNPVMRPDLLRLAPQAAGFALAVDLLEGVGEGIAATHIRDASFIATKRLTSEEWVHLPTAEQKTIDFKLGYESDRDLLRIE